MNLPTSNLIRYLTQLYKTGKLLNDVDDFDDAIELMASSHIIADRLPEGLTEAIPVLERHNIANAVINFNKRSWLYALRELCDEFGSGYFVVSDINLSGKDSLFLIAIQEDASVDTCNKDIQYHIASWCTGVDTIPSIVTGGISKIKMGDNLHYMSAIALQLSTYVRGEL